MRDYTDGYSYFVCIKTYYRNGKILFSRGKNYDIGYSDDHGTSVCGDDEYEIAFLPDDIIDEHFAVAFYEPN